MGLERYFLQVSQAGGTFAWYIKREEKQMLLKANYFMLLLLCHLHNILHAPAM